MTDALREAIIEEAIRRYRNWTRNCMVQAIMPQHGLDYWLVEVAYEYAINGIVR